jgi:hypothetical protein
VCRGGEFITLRFDEKEIAGFLHTAQTNFRKIMK